jgi:proteasome lid subunit RPN8/RPN11
VILPEHVAAAIIDHARETAPEECCGLLIGDDTRVSEAMPARNVADDRMRRYCIDPHDHLRAIRRARERGVQVVGGYHSHPSSEGIPSETDAAEAFTHFLFLIIGLQGRSPDLRAWRWLNGNFSPVPLVRVP